MKKLFTLLLCLMMALSLAACGGNGDSEGGEESNDSVLIIRNSQEPQSFNPDYKADDGAYAIMQNMFNRLVKLGPNDNVVLDLAESYEFSEDGLTLTFHLHDGVTWHDGEPLTSADVKWTYDTCIAESWAKSDNIANIESIECPDDLTVVMHLKTNDVSIIAKLSWYGTFIMPKHLYEGQDTATCEYNMNPVGSGPYKFESYESGVSVTLVANEDYYAGAPKIKKLIYTIVPDDETAYQSFMSDEIDYLGGSLPSVHANDLDNDENFTIYSSLGTNRTYLTVNFEDEIFGQLAVRQAIALGIDRQGIYDRVQNGLGAVAETFISPNFPQFVDEQYKMPERDVEKAIQILEDAGFTKDADGYYIQGTLDIFQSGNWSDVATIIASNLREVGINLEVNVMEMAAWQDKVQVNHNFQITMLAGYQGPDVSGVSGRVQTGSSTNIGQYSNPEMDALLDLAITQTDEAERAATMSEVQRIMSEDLPLILLIDNGYKYPYRNTLTGLPLQVPNEVGASELSKAEFTY